MLRRVAKLHSLMAHKCILAASSTAASSATSANGNPLLVVTESAAQQVLTILNSFEPKIVTKRAVKTNCRPRRAFTDQRRLGRLFRLRVQNGAGQGGEQRRG